MSLIFDGQQLKALKRALYSSPEPDADIRGNEFLNADEDLEDRLRHIDFDGVFRVYAQDDQEQATHFRWAGCVDGFGVDLESFRSKDASWVIVHAVHEPSEAGDFIRSRKSASFVF